MILLMVDLIYNLIIDRWKMIPLQFLNKEEGVDINTNGEDNIAIGYDYIPLRILFVMVIVRLKTTR